MTPKLCWIGVGTMGRGICKNLVTKGSFELPLTLFNRTAQRAVELSESLPEGSTEVSTSIESAVDKADIIFICVGDDKAVESTVDQAVLPSKSLKGKLFVDCSTIHPETTQKIAKRLEEAGADFVACPVFGAAAVAEAGQLVCVMAGPSSGIDRLLRFTKGVIGREDIIYRDQPQQQATLLKIIGNTFILSMVETLAEGHVLAEKSGLGVPQLQQFIQLMFPGPFTAYSQRMSSGDYFRRDRPLFAVDLAIKDSNHALELGKASGTELEVVTTANRHLQDVKRTQGETGDIAGIYGAVREASGLSFEL